jgi:hypothetical protein
MSEWINHVKEFTKHHGMSYKEALSHPECKSSYHSMKGGYSRAYHDKQRRIKQRAINATNKIFEPIGKTGAKVISKVAGPVGRLAGKELGNAAATYLGQPELAPIFGKLGEIIGEKGAVSGSNALNKYVGNGIGVMPKEMRPLQFRGGASSSYDYSHLVIPKSGPGYDVKHATGTEKKHATSFWSWLSKAFGGSIMHNPYEHIEHGTFTKQLKAFNSHHKTKLSLPELAEYVEKHREQFKPITKKRAQFYTNLIEPHIITKGGSIVGFFVSELISMVKSEVKQEAIKIAKDFLKENNIDLEKYSKKVKDDFIETIKRLQQRIRNGENIREIEMTEITIPQPIIDDYIHINDRPQDTDIPIDEENELNDDEFGDTSKIPGLAQGSMGNPYDKYYKKASGIKRRPRKMRGGMNNEELELDEDDFFKLINEYPSNLDIEEQKTREHALQILFNMDDNSFTEIIKHVDLITYLLDYTKDHHVEPSKIHILQRRYDYMFFIKRLSLLKIVKPDEYEYLKNSLRLDFNELINILELNGPIVDLFNEIEQYVNSININDIFKPANINNSNTIESSTIIKNAIKRITQYINQLQQMYQTFSIDPTEDEGIISKLLQFRYWFTYINTIDRDLDDYAPEPNSDEEKACEEYYQLMIDKRNFTPNNPSGAGIKRNPRKKGRGIKRSQMRGCGAAASVVNDMFGEREYPYGNRRPRPPVQTTATEIPIQTAITTTTENPREIETPRATPITNQRINNLKEQINNKLATFEAVIKRIDEIIKNENDKNEIKRLVDMKKNIYAGLNYAKSQMKLIENGHANANIDALKKYILDWEGQWSEGELIANWELELLNLFKKILELAELSSLHGTGIKRRQMRGGITSQQIQDDLIRITRELFNDIRNDDRLMNQDRSFTDKQAIRFAQTAVREFDNSNHLQTIRDGLIAYFRNKISRKIHSEVRFSPRANGDTSAIRRSLNNRLLSLIEQIIGAPALLALKP